MNLVMLLEQSFNGLSMASILLLVALGLALSFGLMRVINMAHGEMLMISGYVAYLCTQSVGSQWYLLLAFPMAFIVTALLGALLEQTVIQKLYGRPLDSLLATWGISLILQQAARQLFGPTGVPVSAPEWLSGAITFSSGPFAGAVIPHARLFVMLVAVLVFVGLLLLMNKTPFGMHVRAVNQNREVARSLGVNTRQVDMMVFALGSGIAGIAGVALALLSPVNPTVGQSYIVNAFLVVILGGIGSLNGTAYAALILGFLTAFTETLTSVSLAKVIILVLIIAFLQIRPRGLVVTRSRVLEDS